MHFALEAVNLTKRYAPLVSFGRPPGPLALAGLNLTVTPGTAFGLIGPNGAGKTTFIKIILGIVRPTSGEVRLWGGRPDDPRVRARVGYLPERLHLPNAWKPPAFLASVSRLKGLAPRESELLSLLGRVGLKDVVDRRIGGFSKGMRQRLGLAAALLGKPDLLILDEPTDGVDPMGRVEVRHLLTAELERGATLFLNSHLLSETERVCNRIGILANGKLVREGPLDVLTRAETLYRVRFAQGLPESVLTEAGFQAVPGAGGTYQLAAPTVEALNVALDRARQSGALLLELTRESRDLEDVLADAVRTAA